MVDTPEIADRLPPNVQLLPDSESGRGVRVAAVLLTLAGAIRVLIFAGSFPLFTNVDEGAHFDLIYRYSQWDIPRQELLPVDANSARLLMLYASPEYMLDPHRRVPPPRWRVPGYTSSQVYADDVQAMMQYRVNHEAASFPLYYILAGVWYQLGGVLGFSPMGQIYWVRFLNVAAFVLLVWMCHKLAAMVMPRDFCGHIGLMVIVAFFPQDLFYMMGSDVLGPGLLAAAMLMLLHIYYEERSTKYYAAAGLVLAATLLAKISNVAVAALAVVVLAMKARQLAAQGGLGRHWWRLVITLVIAAVPTGLWMWRNAVVFGDVTGGAAKAEHLGWSTKPLGQILDHPLLTFRGAGYFLAELTRAAWRGELVWHGQRMATGCTDAFYVGLTAVCVVASASGLILRWRQMGRKYRVTLVLSFVVVGVSVLLLAGLSMVFDFGECWYPSREKPYFVSARLIACAMLPFLFIVFDGLRRVCNLLGRGRVNVLAVTAVIMGLVTVSEIWLSLPAFASRYNWWHTW